MAQYTGGGVTSSALYVTTTALAVTGYALTYDTAYKAVKLATAATDKPMGVSVSTATNSGTDHISYALPGQTVKAIASAAITKGALVGATTGGKFVTVTKGGTQTETNYVWGIAHSAAGADLDVFELYFQPFEMETT